MGRFYRTTKPTFVDDNIYMPPWQLAAKVIGNIDAETDAKIGELSALEGKLKASYLKQDEGRANEIITGYENQIDEITKKIQENPLEYRKDISTIKDLGRSIHEDWTRGEIAAIQGNYQAYQDYLSRGREAVKKGDILQKDFQNASGKYLSDFKGTGYNNGEYQSIATEDLSKYIDVEPEAETLAKGYEADMIENFGASSDGKYIYKNKDKTEFVNYDDVYQGVTSGLTNNKELMDYYKQQISLGFMTPEQAMASIHKAANRVASKYSYKQTSKGTTSLTGDPYGLEEARQANRKALHDYKEGKADPTQSGVNFIDKTNNPLTVEEFSNVVNTSPEGFVQQAGELYAQAKEVGVNTVEGKALIEEARMAELQATQSRQAQEERYTDYLEFIDKKNDPLLSKMVRTLGWDGIQGTAGEIAVKLKESGEFVVRQETRTLANGKQQQIGVWYDKQGNYVGLNNIVNKSQGLNSEKTTFSENWVKDNANSHTATEWFIDLSNPEVAAPYIDFAKGLLLSGDIVIKDGKTGEIVTDLQVDNVSTPFGLFGEDTAFNLKEVMQKMGTDDPTAVFDMSGFKPTSGESAVVVAKLQPGALPFVDNERGGDYILEISGNTLAGSSFNYAKEKGHAFVNGVPQGEQTTGSQVVYEDAFMSMADPSYTYFTKQIQKIPVKSQGTKDKTFTKSINVGNGQTVEVSSIETPSGEILYEAKHNGRSTVLNANNLAMMLSEYQSAYSINK